MLVNTKHKAKCTQFYNITAHAVHTNKKLYAHSYTTLLQMLYAKTHRLMRTIT